MPPASNTIVLKSLSVLLGLFFIFVGTLKLTPHISKDLYKDLRTEYVKYAKVFPLTALFGVKVPSKWYRRTVGILEIVCGLAMALIPYRNQECGQCDAASADAAGHLPALDGK
ncbi:novel acetylcholine receptor chaperone isoform X2 [Drosophila gunungcola]|uniref:novel acetylcholine receptor chaperone isoform X2 n=1 Tax=Drosophila gunungcola TaxID=103775 RepID=UPI0022E137CA|nr:novel acetylcholine receptor chaperone isoform X2 [Drosophila gunungcola]